MHKSHLMVSSPVFLECVRCASVDRMLETGPHVVVWIIDIPAKVFVIFVRPTSVRRVMTAERRIAVSATQPVPIPAIFFLLHSGTRSIRIVAAVKIVAAVMVILVIILMAIFMAIFKAILATMTRIVIFVVI